MAKKNGGLITHALAVVGALALGYALFNVAIALYFLTVMSWR